MKSSEADAIGKQGLLNLNDTTATEFLQSMLGMLESTGLEGTGAVVEFEDIDGTLKSVWIEIWTEDRQQQEHP